MPATPRDPHLDLVDESMHAEAVRERVRERGLRQRDSEAATLAGLLRDLLESGSTVTVLTTGARRHTGLVVDLARDHLTLLGPRDRTFLRLDALAQVRPRPRGGHDVASGDRTAVTDRTLVEALAWVADERPTVVVAGPGMDEPLRGRLIGVGEDVLTIRVDGVGSPVYVPVAAVAELTVAQDG